VREVVDGESELVAVLALHALLGDYASAFDEYIEALIVREDSSGQFSHLLERREVGEIIARLLSACHFANFLEGSLQAFPASAVQQHGGASLGMIGGHSLAQAVGRLPYEDRLLFEVSRLHLSKYPWLILRLSRFGDRML
jgi:hypothetical protein